MRWWRTKTGAGEREVLAFAVEQALRFGEPTVSYGPAGRLYWAVPLMDNARCLGGLVAGLEEQQVYELSEPTGQVDGIGDRDGADDGAKLDLRAACRRLRLLVEQENLTNAAHLAMARQSYVHEQSRHEQLASRKLHSSTSIRQLYLTQEPRLVAAIRAGDRNQSRAVLNRILSQVLTDPDQRFELTRSYFMELVAIVCRAAVEAGGETRELLGTNFQQMTELSQMTNLEQASPWLTQMLERVMDVIEQSRSGSSGILVTDALTYMRTHLSEPIGRDQVAEAMHLSPSHFSRLFKRELGRTFQEEMAAMRIDRARQLLRESDMTVAQVGQAVGIGEPSHFAKVFKRGVGKSPLAYRREAGGAR